MNKILFIFFCAWMNISIAQVQKDAVFWGTLGLDKKLNDRFSIEAVTQWSFNQNMRELSTAFIDLGTSLRLTKSWTLGINYRFIEWRNLDNFYQPIHRFYADASYLKSINQHMLQYRFRWQNQLYDFNFTDPYKNEKEIIRNKLLYKYNLDRKYAIYGSFEHFFRLNQFNRTQAIRTELGIALKQDLHNRFNFYFMQQVLFFTKHPRIDFIYGITYTYKF
ncbi:MAG: hypothetical protein RL074_107 [Bacteroidota bacterium]|jgi:hypothetical protein